MLYILWFLRYLPLKGKNCYHFETVKAANLKVTAQKPLNI